MGKITARVSRYEGIADWYDGVMNDPGKRGGLKNRSHDLLEELLGKGEGLALDIGCGTGIVAERVRNLGYSPVGVDLSADQLKIASGRLPVAQADVTNLPIASNSIPVVYTTFTTTEYDDLQGVINEIYRVLKPGGRYVEIGTHPCFNGGYAEIQADGSVIQHPGYRSSHYLQPSHFNSPIRGRVGAWNRPLEDILNTILNAGFRLDRVAEGGEKDLPDILGIVAVKDKGEN
ncbi:Methyltransferase type 11 [Syntrophobotulus glycolicus DSM 8271]|uniref:Methyltransferase type 11 n=1 Tax=Syntrophobotulus glycolicus (strain DSM 8271 / FlGlyR) TaxID=645991 RepID=F0SVS5_SYNGF|nr:methyltransferase domain-containing protein [Syntrophobotulus glycolicus]ADY55631.1 Methyltransferase type 11 [Syntrophobotulus glycolicus DSM 8271]